MLRVGDRAREKGHESRVHKRLVQVDSVTIGGDIQHEHYHFERLGVNDVNQKTKTVGIPHMAGGQ